MDEETNDMQSVIDAARAGVQPTRLLNSTDEDALYYLPNPDGTGRVVPVSMEKFCAYPGRKRGTVTVFDVASLNALIHDNRSDDYSVVIYLNADVARPGIVAVLNSNGPKGPGWQDFRVSVRFTPTPQWLKWFALDGKLIPQADFAEFIEDNLVDIFDPPGATMLEISQNLEATRTASFKSAMRISDGTVQLQNLEDIDTKVGPMLISVPEKFTLAIAPWLGCNPYTIPTRFRYRLEGGKLKLGFKMQRVEDMVRDLFNEFAAQVVQDEFIRVVEGLPPEPVQPLCTNS